MKRSKVPVAETGLALPPEVVEEILLRIPAKQLRRFRAVCRSWCSLISDPTFIKAHAAMHPGLILALAADKGHIDVVDFSGSIVKQIRVPTAQEEAALSAHPGRSFLFQANNRVRMVDPYTGGVFTLPFDNHDDPVLRRQSTWSTRTDYVIGRDTSTGHHKVLRILTHANLFSSPLEQVCHVLSLTGDNDNRQRWRQRPSPPMFVRSDVDFHGVTIGGFVFFLAGSVFNTYDDIHDRCNDRMYNMNMESIASFDLEKEQWRPATLHGPPEINIPTGAYRHKLAELSHTLVMITYHVKFDDAGMHGLLVRGRLGERDLGQETHSATKIAGTLSSGNVLIQGHQASEGVGRW
jgi:hypothetical protein